MYAWVRIHEINHSAKQAKKTTMNSQWEAICRGAGDSGYSILLRPRY